MQNNHESNSSKLIYKNEFNLESFFNLTPSILCIASPEGILKKVNPAFAKTLGYNMEELIEKPVSTFIHPEDVATTSKLRNRISENRPMINFENRYITKEGNIVWLSWTSTYEPNDQLIYAVAKDVTEIKKLEEKKNSIFLELTRANKELKKLAYTTSHDLRSPIDNIISLFSFMDFSKSEFEKNISYMELFYTSILKLKQTLNGHLDALSTKDKMNTDIEKVNLKDTYDIVIDSIKELIFNSKASIYTDFSEAPNIKFSSFYLQSIFLNLISNSIRYADPNRDLTLSIKSQKVNQKTQLIFSDNGIGFDDKNDDVFSIHQSLHNHKESKGIGLFLVKSHMETLGGSVSVKSKINQGTTFTLLFN